MIKIPSRSSLRKKRQMRIRKKVKGSDLKPRLCVFRSNKHMYAQIINDKEGRTLAAASTRDKDLSLAKTWNKEAAAAVGTLLAQRAKAAGVEAIVFDRSGYLYHGKVQALADAAREAGLKF